MEIEFDPAKDAANIAKHGMSLTVGDTVLRACVSETVDDRRDYGEVRYNAFAWIAGRLVVCTYTRRGTAYRIVSVRQASRKERAGCPT